MKWWSTVSASICQILGGIKDWWICLRECKLVSFDERCGGFLMSPVSLNMQQFLLNYYLNRYSCLDIVMICLTFFWTKPCCQQWVSQNRSKPTDWIMVFSYVTLEETLSLLCLVVQLKVYFLKCKSDDNWSLKNMLSFFRTFTWVHTVSLCSDGLSVKSESSYLCCFIVPHHLLSVVF